MGLAKKDRQGTKKQGEQYAGKDRNSNILPFSAVCDPTGKTGKRGEYIDDKQLKQGLDLYMPVFTGITEEPGWRGFALPRLQSRYSAENASWILGILWGVWHFPFIIYYTYGAGIAPLVASLLGLTLGIVGWTIVNTWIYNNTRSVWMMILLHGWGTQYSPIWYCHPIISLCRPCTGFYRGPSRLFYCESMERKIWRALPDIKLPRKNP